MATRLTLAAFLTISIASLSGCKIAEKGIEVQKDAIGVRILEGGVHPQLHIEKGAVTVEPGAVSQPLVAQGAVQLKVEPGAVQFHAGAIQFNVGQKGPPIDISEVVKSLQQLKPVGDLGGLSNEQQQQIIANEAIMQEAIKVILRLIQDYNKNFTTGAVKESPKETDPR